MLNAHAMSDRRWTIHPLQEQLKSEAKSQGLWNLWIPEDMARSLTPLVRSSVFDGQEAALLLGPGLSNLEYAHCAEIMGASVWAPGNITFFITIATELKMQQKKSVCTRTFY